MPKNVEFLGAERVRCLADDERLASAVEHDIVDEEFAAVVAPDSARRSTARMRASSTVRSSGLTRKSSAPASRILAMSDSDECTV